MRAAAAGHAIRKLEGNLWDLCALAARTVAVTAAADRLSTSAEGNLRDLGALARVFVAREGRLLGALAGKMAGAQGGPAVFEVWMKQQSDLVQARAAALRATAAASSKAL